MNAETIQDQTLVDLLNPVNVDEREYEDGIGAVGELGDSFVKRVILLR